MAKQRDDFVDESLALIVFLEDAGNLPHTRLNHVRQVIPRKHAVCTPQRNGVLRALIAIGTKFGIHFRRIFKRARLRRHARNGVLFIEHPHTCAYGQTPVAGELLKRLSQVKRCIQHVAPVTYDKQVVAARIDDLQAILPRREDLVDLLLEEQAERTA